MLFREVLKLLVRSRQKEKSFGSWKPGGAILSQWQFPLYLRICGTSSGKLIITIASTKELHAIAHLGSVTWRKVVASTEVGLKRLKCSINFDQVYSSLRLFAQIHAFWCPQLKYEVALLKLKTRI